MKRLGKVPKGHNPQGDIFHFGTDYKFCPEAGLSEAQVKALRAALAVTRGKIWRIVNARWKEAPTVMKAAMDAQGMVLTVDQFTSDANFQGDCLLEVPGKWVTGGVRGRRYMEGGLLLVRRTGSSCTAWMASNELLRADGEKAWGNFEWWFNRTIIAYDGLEAVSVPMSMILGRVKPSFTRSKTLAARNLACQRIRDAIGYMREKAAEAAKLASKPAEPAAAAPKKARKRATKKATAAK